MKLSLHVELSAQRERPAKPAPKPAGTPAGEEKPEPPRVDVKGAGTPERAVHGRRVGFTVDPNPGIEPWW